MASTIHFGQYELIRRLGAGGMAEVYLARRSGPAGFEKLLVIKRILPHLSTAGRFTEMFLREARWAALIDHPNLAHVSDFGQFDGRYYLAMEYVDGFTLAELLQKRRRFSPGVACRIVVDVLAALQAIHTAVDHYGHPLELVHRDVSPRNIMVSRDGSVKLLDLGIAVEEHTQSKPRCGTRRHMSPEQLEGSDIDRRSDIYCSAVLLFLLITGHVPDKPGPEHTSPGEVPDALWPVIESALAVDRDKRPKSASDFGADLEIFLASIGLEGTRAHLLKELSPVLEAMPNSARILLTRLVRMTRLDLPRTKTERRNTTRPIAHPTSLPAKTRRRVGLFLLLGSTALFGSVGVLSGPKLIRQGTNLLSSQQPKTEAEPEPKDSPMLDERQPPPKPPSQTDTRGREPAIVLTGQDDDHSEGPSVLSQQPEEAPVTASARRSHPIRRSKRSRAKQGWLTIDTRPWTRVFLHDRPIGLTPMEGVPLPPGQHQLRLENLDFNIQQTLVVTIRAGRVTRIQRTL